MKKWLALKAMWVLWRLPRLWMNPTRYYFWIMREREKLQAQINRQRRLTSLVMRTTP
jgi:hypothetical protein